ncbi:hypothetical protein HYH02_010589 [Chlamydomonas schloesseri]|uniref:Uncharacterized protein n=1 Tax=Chlamydomonas schloesseri TaxID=2026947 RepID=A0A835TJ29_9CHLO|nr:hypothetical protein HYH02_010589 [Chlamydomonas schloesseri]|eukprot:KAG2439710.1 hypothetical protein HYH02_010589 [Chlamydomonas schloesseri]
MRAAPASHTAGPAHTIPAGAPAARRGQRAGWKQPRARRVVVRTSEHWWEDEEEFDAITEIVIPKKLHLAVVSADTGAASQADWAVLATAKEAVVKANAGGKFASGFTGQPSKALADALWSRLGQDGAPFFKKCRVRDSLSTLEAPGASADEVLAAAEALWTELCGQTWRPELDYGVAGGDTNPTDQLLLACSSLAAERLLAHAGLAADGAARAAGYALVSVPGYSAAEAAGPDGQPVPLESWRQLGAFMGEGAAAAAANAAQASGVGAATAR